MDDQLAAIRGETATLQKSMDRMSRDMSDDRKELSDIQIRLGALESQVAELVELVRKLPTRVGDKVDDALEPITDALDEVKKKPFWKKLIK